MSSKPKSRHADDPGKKEEKERLERELTAGLEGTFPASDPVAVTQPGPDGKIGEAAAQLAPAIE